MNPVIALFLGWAFLGEPITPAILVGSAIVIVAVVFVTTARMPKPVPTPAIVDPRRLRRA